jgi:hypothetical protein
LLIALQFLESKETPSNLNALVDLASTGDSAPLEAALMDFFAAYRVSGPDDTLQLPKRGTVDSIRSNIKVFVLHKSDGKVNISDGSVFKRMEGSSRGISNNSRLPDVERLSTLLVRSCPENVSSCTGFRKCVQQIR